MRTRIIPLVCVSLSIINSSHSYAQKTSLQRPNIVFILIDDLGWTDLSFNGSNYYETPHIDRLRNNGVYFPSAYASSSNSAPSRACILTGLNTPRHGVYTVEPADRGRREDRKIQTCFNKPMLDEDAYLLPMALKEAGYHTCHIGKWHIGKDPLKQGMETNIGGTIAGHPKSYFAPYQNPALKDGPDGEYLMDRLADEAANYIDTVDKRKPFFLYYATYAVHTPLQAKPKLIDKYKRKIVSEFHNNPVYAAMVENMDACVGRVLEALRRNNLDDNTLVVFTSDNGGVYHISRQWPLRAGKGSFYEGGIRIPLIISMKHKYKGGTTIESPVSLLDMFPTLTEVAGITSLPIFPDGESLLPVLDRGDTSRLDHRTLFWHFPAYLEGGHRESRDTVFRQRPASVVMRDRWKLIENYEDHALELYNLNEDPSETTDLNEFYPEEAEKLYNDLLRWKSEVNAPIPDKSNPWYKKKINPES